MCSPHLTSSNRSSSTGQRTPTAITARPHAATNRLQRTNAVLLSALHAEYAVQTKSHILEHTAAIRAQQDAAVLATMDAGVDRYVCCWGRTVVLLLLRTMLVLTASLPTMCTLLLDSKKACQCRCWHQKNDVLALDKLPKSKLEHMQYAWQAAVRRRALCECVACSNSALAQCMLRLLGLPASHL